MSAMAGGNVSSNNNDSKRGLLVALTRKFLRERLQLVQNDPSVKETDRLTLSTVWYRLRPQFYAIGLFTPEDLKGSKKNVRKMVQVQYVREICEKELGKKRAELGIYAAARAQLYWNGEAFDVTLKNIDKLIEHGVIVLIIEKEGIADVLAPFAAKKGIAILNVRGFMTENADDYSQLVLEKLGGNNVATLHDFDSAGVLIGKKAAENGIVSIGVDPELLAELEKLLPRKQDKKKVSMSALEEPYDGSGSTHWKGLKDKYPDYEHLDYIKDKRIEIDSITAAIGVEKLWEGILARLDKEFPSHNYTRVINPDSIFIQREPPTIDFEYSSTVIDKLNDHITSRTEEIAKDKKSQFVEELEDYPGIHDVDELSNIKRDEYDEACLDADKESLDVGSVCEPIIKQLEEEIEEKTAEQQSDIESLREQIQALEDEIEDKDREIDEIADEVVERAETDLILPAIRKLDEEKGYNIVQDARLLEEKEEDDEEEE